MRSAPAAFLGIVVEILTLCGSLPAQSPCGNNGPGFTCSGGGQAVCQGSSWICNCGAQCSIPPPYIGTCTCGEECTGDGSWQCSNCSGSSIIIDTKGEGFRLTNVADGVKFKFFPNRPPVQISWTDPAFSNGFLVLDRNGDGLISDGTELFGKLTPQPQSATPNGCLALAVFDQPENGGNGDGFIDAQDAVYDRLRVWIDANHDGISELREMHTLKELGIARIDLKYHLSHYVDEFGNEFRYRSRIWDEAGSEHEVCYDVFLETSDRNQAVWHGGSVDGTESGTMCVAPPPQRVLQGCPVGPACGIHGWQCASGGPSPIILDISGHGFHLTDVANGVKFAFYPGQPPFQMSWTDAAYGNGFLALDRNGDGMINDGSELFGNITPQPPSATPNGHLALAVSFSYFYLRAFLIRPPAY